MNLKHLIAIVILGAAVWSCEKEPECGEEYNGKLGDRCSKVDVDYRGYKSDGETYEEFFMGFRLGVGVTTIFIKDADGLVTKGTYTEEDGAYYSGGTTSEMEVNITKVERKQDGGSLIWGNFHAIGWGNSGRGFDVSGSFDGVVLPD